MASTLQPRRETQWICERAKQIGFELCGVAVAEKFPELLNYPEWLERGYAGEMKYLSDPRRLDPRSAMSGVRSLIVCALNYNTPFPYSTEVASRDQRNQDGRPHGWISRYAWGDDYHEVLWEKLNRLTAEMRSHFAAAGPFEARAYADTGPIHERAAAKYAGVGWLGKNTLLINQAAGSWLFLGTILTTLELAPTVGEDEGPPPDRCGTCRACIDACPTQAIVEPYVLDASRCIAYLTIEHRGSIPEGLREPMGMQVFGCDICQDVCPWNRKAPRTDVAEFQPRRFSVPAVSQAPESLFLPDLIRLAELSETGFREQLRGSPVKRAKWRGLVRNACVALGNSKMEAGSPAYKEALSMLQVLSELPDEVIAESARWALSRIQRKGQQAGGDSPTL